MLKLSFYLLLFGSLLSCGKASPIIGKWDLVKKDSEFKFCERLVLTENIQVCDGVITSIKHINKGEVWDVLPTNSVDSSWTFKVISSSRIALIVPDIGYFYYVKVSP